MTFLDEIRDQPRRLRRLAEDLGRRGHPVRAAAAALEPARTAVLTGMGSSLYACYPAYLRLAGRAALWETGELIHYGFRALEPEGPVVAVSQSGETAEILTLLDRIGPRRQVIAVTNVAESTLGRRSGVVLEIGADRSSHASSQTFLNSLALLLALAHRVSGEPLDPLLGEIRRAADALDALLEESFTRTDTVDRSCHLVLLARGPSLASARQAALMMHEVAAKGASAMSCAAFRHGPLEMAGPGLHAVVFEPHGPTAALVEALAAELEGWGARVTRIADHRLGRGDYQHAAVWEELAPLVNLAPLQAWACRSAAEIGREPGVFRQGQPVTRRE